MPKAIFSPGDEVLFSSKKFTLIESAFKETVPMWLCCETDNPNAQLRLLIEKDLRCYWCKKNPHELGCRFHQDAKL